MPTPDAKGAASIIPAHRRVAEAVVTEDEKHVRDGLHRARRPVGREADVSHQSAHATTNITRSTPTRSRNGTPRVVAWAITPPSDRAAEHRGAGDHLPTPEHGLEATA